MKSRAFWVPVLLFALLALSASRFPASYVAEATVANAAPNLVEHVVRSPYYALCNDSSHGVGCAGTHTWCGPERDNHAAAKADADSHKKANPSHNVTVYHVP